MGRMCRIEGSLPMGKSAAHASPSIFWNQVLTLTALTSRLSVMWAACLENGRVLPPPGCRPALPAAACKLL